MVMVMDTHTVMDMVTHTDTHMDTHMVIITMDANDVRAKMLKVKKEMSVDTHIMCITELCDAHFDALQDSDQLMVDGKLDVTKITVFGRFQQLTVFKKYKNA